MPKKYIFTSLFLFVGLLAMGQNLPQFTQYTFNQFYFNPGAAGMYNRTMVQSTVRSQYTGYQADQSSGGGILSTAFSADMPLQFLKGGAGIYFASQNISEAQTKGELSLSYSYHRSVNGNVVGLGAGIGLNNLKLSGNHFNPRDPEDPFIPDSKLTSLAPVVNAGVYFMNPGFELGLSVKNVLENNYNIGGTDGLFNEKRQYYFTGKYDLGISYMMDISPMFLIRTDLITTSTELGAIATYNQKFWAGVNYRFQDAVSLLTGATFMDNKLKLGYALDIVTSGVKAKSLTSHEIFLRYVLNTVKTGKKSIIRTPRYNIQ